MCELFCIIKTIAKCPQERKQEKQTHEITKRNKLRWEIERSKGQNRKAGKWENGNLVNIAKCHN